MATSGTSTLLITQSGSPLTAKPLVIMFRASIASDSWAATDRIKRDAAGANSSAVGLHNALARIFRSASEAERFGVLKAHPDLAGKLAAAKRLTSSVA